jgi:hypothetical protein
VRSYPFFLFIGVQFIQHLKAWDYLEKQDTLCAGPDFLGAVGILHATTHDRLSLLGILKSPFRDSCMCIVIRCENVGKCSHGRRRESITSDCAYTATKKAKRTYCVHVRQRRVYKAEIEKQKRGQPKRGFCVSSSTTPVSIHSNYEVLQPPQPEHIKQASSFSLNISTSKYSSVIFEAIM